MDKDELEAVALLLADGEMETLPSDEVRRLMTVGQYLFDRGLNVLEARGELEWADGSPVVPYDSDHMLETALTRMH